MPGEDGQLSPEDIEKLNAYLAAHCGDDALTCPITGERVPIADWNAPDRVLKLPGGDATYDALALTSPAGGVVLLSVLKLGL